VCGKERVGCGSYGSAGLGTGKIGPAEIWIEPAKLLEKLVYDKPESKDRSKKIYSQTVIHYRFSDGVVLKLDDGESSGEVFIGEKKNPHLPLWLQMRTDRTRQRTSRDQGKALQEQ
jgi:hypothetical protein